MNRSALQPNHHAIAANRAESRTSAPRIASSHTAAGAESCLAACWIGGDGTPGTCGWLGTVGAGVGVSAVAVGVGVGCGARVGVDAVRGPPVRAAGAGAAPGFLLQP